jgi:methionyl-tRNA formyltransferase
VGETLGLLAGGWAQPAEQDESRASRAPKLSKADGRVRFDAPAETVRALIHGTWPWPGAHAVFRKDGRKDVDVILARAEAVNAPSISAPGRIEDDLTVATSEGRLRIVELKPSGKRLMHWRDFANGYRLAPGDLLTQRDDA